MSYSAIVTKLTNIRKHSNADRLQVATILGEQVIIGMSDKEGDLGIYFPCDGCLSQEFLKANDLISYKDEAGNKKGGFFDAKGRVRAQKFRGEVSDGFWCPISFLEKVPGIKSVGLKEGDNFNTINGIEICTKYVTEATLKAARTAKNEKNKKKKISQKITLVFPQHLDTEAIYKNLHKLIPGSILYITSKMHGTSARYGYCKEICKKVGKFSRFLKWLGFNIDKEKYVYSYGTRRVNMKTEDGGYYGNNQFRFDVAQPFIKNLYKGEIVYGELVGFLPNGKPIMPTVSADTIKDKEFQKCYGKSITWSYGCNPGECKFYVYRISMINDDGEEVDLSWPQMNKRATHLGLECVKPICEPLYVRNDGTIVGMETGASYQILDLCKEITKGQSVLDNKHPKEGCVIRVENQHKLNCFKYKTFEFRVLEGLAKDNTNYVDEEEMQDEQK